MVRTWGDLHWLQFPTCSVLQLGSGFPFMWNLLLSGIVKSEFFHSFRINFGISYSVGSIATISDADLKSQAVEKHPQSPIP